MHPHSQAHLKFTLLCIVSLVLLPRMLPISILLPFSHALPPVRLTHVILAQSQLVQAELVQSELVQPKVLQAHIFEQSAIAAVQPQQPIQASVVAESKTTVCLSVGKTITFMLGVSALLKSFFSLLSPPLGARVQIDPFQQQQFALHRQLEQREREQRDRQQQPTAPPSQNEGPFTAETESGMHPATPQTQPHTQTHVDAQNHPLSQVKIEPQTQQQPETHRIIQPENAFDAVSFRRTERSAPAIIRTIYTSSTSRALSLLFSLVHKIKTQKWSYFYTSESGL